MMEGHHYQIAYVTRNCAKAVADFKARTSVRHEQFYDGPSPLTVIGVGPSTMVCKIALLWVENMQYEFIEPVSGQVDLYRQALPVDDAPVFHHTAIRVSDWAALHEHIARQSLPIAQYGQAGPLNFLYVDARAWLGHYLEFVSMPDEMWSAMGGLSPISVALDKA